MRNSSFLFIFISGKSWKLDDFIFVFSTSLSFSLSFSLFRSLSLHHCFSLSFPASSPLPSHIWSYLNFTNYSRQRPTPTTQALPPAATAFNALPAVPTLQMIPHVPTPATAASFTADEMASMPRKTIYVSSSSLGGIIKYAITMNFIRNYSILSRID